MSEAPQYTPSLGTSSCPSGSTAIISSVKRFLKEEGQTCFTRTFDSCERQVALSGLPLAATALKLLQ